MATEPTEAPKKAKSGWVNLLVDYGPLLVFFLVYKHFSPEGEDAVGEVFAVVRGTGAFIAAAIIALIVSRIRLGKISPMLLLSTVLIVGFGSITIFLQDPFFVQIKPTVVYLLFAAALLIGWWRGKPLLKWLLEAAFEGLSEAGWMKLSRNWGIFFIFLAGMNETLRMSLSFGDWLAAKLWVFMPLSFLFTFTQLPMLMKHGLAPEGVSEEESRPPPP